MATTHNRNALAKHAPLAGLAAAGLYVLGFVLLEVGVGTPGVESTPQEIAAFFDKKGGPLLLGHFVLGVGVLCLLIFLSRMFSLFESGESESSRFIARLGLASGVAVGTLIWASSAPQIAAVFASQERSLSPPTAETLLYVTIQVVSVGGVRVSVLAGAV